MSNSKVTDSVQKMENKSSVNTVNDKDTNNNVNDINNVNSDLNVTSPSTASSTNNGTTKSSPLFPSKEKQSGKRFRLPFFKKKSSKSGKPLDDTIGEDCVVTGRRRTSSVGEKDMEAIRKNSKSLALRRGHHGIEPETQSAPVN